MGCDNATRPSLSPSKTTNALFERLVDRIVSGQTMSSKYMYCGCENSISRVCECPDAFSKTSVLLSQIALCHKHGALSVYIRLYPMYDTMSWY